MATAAAGPGTARPRESFSQFVARILDQLSVSAWLPSAALVMSAIFLVQVREEGGSPADALAEITSFGLAEVVLCIGAIVIGTVLTQAFEFEAIRTLEGYWAPGRVRGALARWRCRVHVGERKALASRQHDALVAAFAQAEIKMRKKHVDARLIEVVKGELFDFDTGASDEERERAKRVPWKQYGDPDKVRLAEAINVRLRSYPPAEHRVMPTRLGNTLRAHEDRALDRLNEELEGFVLRRFHELPEPLQVHHDQRRTRLDLYCSMIFVAGLVGAFGVALLWPFSWIVRASVVGVALATAWISYRAAVVSARAYGGTLEEIGAWVARKNAAMSTATRSST